MRSFGFTLGVLALAAAAFLLGTHWATRGPGGSRGERARSALADPDPIARATALLPVLRDLETSELAEVEEAYRASVAGDGPRDPAIALLAEAWAALDPAGALDRVSSWPAAASQAAQKALLRAWARRNRTAAMEWAAGARGDGTALEAVFAGWAESGDPGMWDFVATQMQPSMERESASIAMMQQVVAHEGFEALLARVDALPDDGPGGFKSAAIGTATGLVADQDPERALAFADRYAEGPYGQGLLQRVMVRWITRDGAAALQNLLDRPASKERDTALRRTYIRWLRRDRAAAMAWMPEAAAVDPRFTTLVDVYAVALAKNDPENPGEAIRRAIRWAEPTPDAEKRHAAMVQLGVLWLYYEPDAASAWLTETGLDAEVRAEAARYERIQRGMSGRAS